MRGKFPSGGYYKKENTFKTLKKTGTRIICNDTVCKSREYYMFELCSYKKGA